MCNLRRSSPCICCFVEFSFIFTAAPCVEHRNLNERRTLTNFHNGFASWCYSVRRYAAAALYKYWPYLELPLHLTCRQLNNSYI